MRLASWLNGLPIHWESRGTPLALGRCFIAGAVLLSIVFTSDSALLGTNNGRPASGNCDGLGSLSLWCHSDVLPGGPLTARIVSICVLVVAVSGYRPRWICIPQWYVTFSIGSSIFAMLGVDSAAKAMTLLLIPICLGDPRVWQWQRPADPVSPGWRGAAFASHMVVRLQVFIIYATAVVSKLVDTSWQHGVAIYFVANDPSYGFPPPLLALLDPFLGSYWLVATLSWSVVAIQGVIAVTIIGTRRMRLIALCCSLALHLAIGILMSLPTFSLAMIGLVLAAYGGHLRLPRTSSTASAAITPTPAIVPP
jgi:antimicrobial peptide system SdpB family protein